MPRPRFERLEAEKQLDILDAATREFAEHGFQNASFNRIIENAGLSKGAMYYYFDDKKDLFLTVLRRFQREIVAELPPLREVRDADDYWDQLDSLLRRGAEVKKNRPEFIQLALSLFKSMLSGEVALPHDELFGEATRWAEEVVAVGQRAGAVRTDVPVGLLVSMVFGVMHAVDLWLLQFVERIEQINYETATVFSIGLFRRLLEPGPDAVPGQSLLNDVEH